MKRRQKIDILHYEAVGFGEFSSGKFSQAREYDLLPLDLNVVSITWLIEIETAFDGDMNFTDVIYQHNNDVGFTNTINELVNSFAAGDDRSLVMWLPDNLEVCHFPFIEGTLGEAWLAETQYVNQSIMAEASIKSQLSMNITPAGANFTAGIMHIYKILECEVL